MKTNNTTNHIVADGIYKGTHGEYIAYITSGTGINRKHYPLGSYEKLKDALAIRKEAGEKKENETLELWYKTIYLPQKIEKGDATGIEGITQLTQKVKDYNDKIKHVYVNVYEPFVIVPDTKNNYEFYIYKLGRYADLKVAFDIKFNAELQVYENAFNKNSFKEWFEKNFEIKNTKGNIIYARKHNQN